MYEELLRECGLTQNESLVYLALLKLGKAKSGEIVKNAKISGGKIYETLYKLIDKGLVKIVIENKIKHFIANDPRTLISYIKEKERKLLEKEKELEKIIPELERFKITEKKLDSVSLLKGFRGIKEVVYPTLKTSNNIKIMGVTSKKDVKYNNFWKAWHNERLKLKKEAKMIFSDRNTDYWRFFKSLKHTKVREITYFTPSAILVIDEEVFIFSYEEELVCIHIDSKSISESFSSFFEGLWKVAKP